MDPKNPDFQAMMSSFMQNTKKMQENMRQAYQELAEKNKDSIVKAQAGGDLVIAHVNLKMQVTQLELAPALFEEKHEVIAQLIASAVNQGIGEAQKMMRQEMAELTKKMGLPPSDKG